VKAMEETRDKEREEARSSMSRLEEEMAQLSDELSRCSSRLASSQRVVDGVYVFFTPHCV
jgi:chromosome segregation ATPase